MSSPDKPVLRPLAGAPGGELSEGPLWHPDGQCLSWVDINAGQVHRWQHDTGQADTIEVGELVAAAIPRGAGGLLLALAGEVATRDPNGSLGRRTPVETGVPGNRLNDAKCDPAGRLYVGSMAKSSGAAALYRVDADWRVTPVLTGTTISNGLGWSPDGSRMYFNDTGANSTYVFDYDVASAAMTNQRVLCKLGDGEGHPDGLTVDAEGCVWVACYGGGAVRRFTPDGELATVLRLPVTNATSCTFGGPDLGELFVTTAYEGLSDAERAEQPEAGRVFSCRPGVTGLPVTPFAG